MEKISFNDFKKLDLRVGKVLEAGTIKGSDKLLKLKVNIGNETRQILAGIRKYYLPEKLIGREIVIITNLKPRMILGFESQGMLLAADLNGEPIIINPEREVEPGTKIH